MLSQNTNSNELRAYAFAVRGLDAPKLFPTKLDVIKVIPRGIINKKAIILTNKILVPSSTTPRYPDRIESASNPHISNASMIHQGIPYLRNSPRPLKESLFI